MWYRCGIGAVRVRVEEVRVAVLGGEVLLEDADGGDGVGEHHVRMERKPRVALSHRRTGNCLLSERLLQATSKKKYLFWYEHSLQFTHIVSIAETWISAPPLALIVCCRTLLLATKYLFNSIEDSSFIGAIDRVDISPRNCNTFDKQKVSTKPI